MRVKDATELRRLILDRYSSYASLARRMQVSPATISHLTTGRMKTCAYETAHDMAEALGADVHDLFDRRERRPLAGAATSRSVRHGSVR